MKFLHMMQAVGNDKSMAALRLIPLENMPAVREAGPSAEPAAPEPEPSPAPEPAPAPEEPEEPDDLVIEPGVDAPM